MTDNYLDLDQIKEISQMTVKKFHIYDEKEITDSVFDLRKMTRFPELDSPKMVHLILNKLNESAQVEDRYLTKDVYRTIKHVIKNAGLVQKGQIDVLAKQLEALSDSHASTPKDVFGKLDISCLTLVYPAFAKNDADSATLTAIFDQFANENNHSQELER